MFRRLANRFINSIAKMDLKFWGCLYLVFILAFVTRFLPPLTPETGLVFDEAYFVPQVESYAVNRYYFDPHPPLGKILMYYGMILINPDASEKLNPDLLANKVDNYKTPLDLDGIRLMPKIFGTLVPVMMFLLVWELYGIAKQRKNSAMSHNRLTNVSQYLMPLVAGLMLVFENTFIVESRHALLSQFLIFFMLSACYASIRYYNAQGGGKMMYWLVMTGITFGAAMAVKILAAGILPFILLALLMKEWKIRKETGRVGDRSLEMGENSEERDMPKSKFQLLTTNSRILGSKLTWIFYAISTATFMLLVSFGTFVLPYYWHFNQIKHYAPAADEVVQPFLEDLHNGTNNTSFVVKFLDYLRLSDKYQQYVPKLDYSKDDEIGSMWITWPIMARPINYYMETYGDGQHAYVFLLGNPAVWALSLAGIVILTALFISRILNGKLKPLPRPDWIYLAVLGLYFANWLPFAVIERVMYLYHYLPALAFGIIAFVLVLSDFIVPRGIELLQFARRWSLESNKFSSWKKIYRLTLNFMPQVVVVLLLVLIVGVFAWYFPFAYLRPMTQEPYEQHILLKEWNMRW